MSIRAAHGDGEITKPKTVFGAQQQRGRTEQGFHLLSLGSTAAPGQAVVVYVNRDLSQGSGKNCNVNNVSSEDATPTGVGGENSHTRISPSSCTGAWTEAVPHLLSSTLTGRVHNIWCLQQLSERCGNIQKVLVP